MSRIPADIFCQLMLLDAEVRADLLEFAGSTPIAPALMLRLVDGAAQKKSPGQAPGAQISQ